MIQVNNGFADYYYLLEDGTIYNKDNDRIIMPDAKHMYKLRTKDNKYKKIALRTLYKLVYNKRYYIDKIEDLDNEQWKEVNDTDQRYYVSNKGRIKSLKGYEAMILKPYKNLGGYERVDIVEDGQRHSKLVSRLVAAAFLPLPDRIDMQLHHKDFNKENNAADNLCWLTPAAHAEIHKNKEKK